MKKVLGMIVLCAVISACAVAASRVSGTYHCDVADIKFQGGYARISSTAGFNADMAFRYDVEGNTIYLKVSDGMSLACDIVNDSTIQCDMYDVCKK